jgi:hypothetical protein
MMKAGTTSRFLLGAVACFDDFDFAVEDFDLLVAICSKCSAHDKVTYDPE